MVLDESPTQLIGEVRQPIPAGGAYRAYDCGIAVCRGQPVRLLDAHQPWRRVKVTTRTARDFAQCMRDLVDLPIRGRASASCSITCRPRQSALYEAFPAPEAHRILRRLEFHYTPKHASWLNMIEIEIGVLRSQCLDRRIDDRKTLEAEIAAWESQRNATAARIKWMFTTQRARIKLLRAYPDPANES